MLGQHEPPVPRIASVLRGRAAAAALPVALIAAIGLSAAPVTPAGAFEHGEARQALAAWVPHFSCGSVLPGDRDDRSGHDRLSTPLPDRLSGSRPTSNRASSSTAGSASRSTGGSAADRIRGRLGRLHEAVTTGRFRTGSGVRVQCFGANERAAHPVTWHLRLEQLEPVRSLNGDRSLTAFEQRHVLDDPRDQRRTTGSTVAEVITLPDASLWRASADGASLRASQAGRRAGAACPNTATGRCSTSSFIDWRLGGTEQHPELVQTRYIGGVASDAVLWRLGR